MEWLKGKYDTVLILHHLKHHTKVSMMYRIYYMKMHSIEDVDYGETNA